MKIHIKVRDLAGGLAHVTVNPVLKMQAPASYNSQQFPLWAQLHWMQCATCPFNPSEVKWCPAAVSIADLVDSVLAQKKSYDFVDAEIERDGVRCCSRCDLQTLMGEMLLYRLCHSGCPRLSSMAVFSDCFSPVFSQEKVFFQLCVTRLMLGELTRRAGRDFGVSPVDPKAFARIFGQIKQRLNIAELSLSEAIPNALALLQSLLVFCDEFSDLFYGDWIAEFDRLGDQEKIIPTR
jgi:hypothetical protein